MPGGSTGGSVGQIDLDLGLNQSRFNKQVNALEKTTKKQFTGLTSFLSNFLANAASQLLSKLAAGLKDFVKDSIDQASDLAEVQNVVDTVFTTMSDQVNEFAKSASKSFGLSETIAKRYMGQLGAMSKAFGYSEEQSYNLARSITGLTADVASFYNLSTEEAFTKTKSIFTGETESLKELGVVMSQAALDAFALSNGFGKATSEMSEAEKVALRYKFVMKQLEAAQGDFARTSDGWANQVRGLSLAWDDFKGALGEGFIAALTPVVQMMNTLLVKMTQVAKTFSALIKHFMGVKEDTSGAASGIIDAADASATLAENTEATAAAAESAKKSILGFDEINKLGDDSGTSDSNALGDIGTFDWGDTSLVDESPVNTTVDKIIRKFEELEGKIKDAGTSLSEYFAPATEKVQAAIDGINAKRITDNAKSIYSSLIEMSDGFVIGLDAAASGMVSFLGSSVAALITTGGLLVDVGMGTVSKYLEDNKARLSTWAIDFGSAIGGAFNAMAGTVDRIMGIVVTSVNNAYEPLTQGLATFGTGITSIFTNVSTIVAEMLWVTFEQVNFWLDENQSALTEMFTGILEFFGNTAALIGEILTDIGDSTGEWWENSFKPIFADIVRVILEVVGEVVRVWNEIIQPVLDDLVSTAKNIWDESLKPLWDKVLEFISSVGEFLVAFWDTILQPLVSFIVEVLKPIIIQVAQSIFDKVQVVFKFISGVISGIIDMLRGVLTFLTGVFTGDFKKALEGLKLIGKGFVNALASAVEFGFNVIISGVNGAINLVISAIEGLVNGAVKLAKKLASGLVDTSGWNGLAIPRANIGKISIPRLAEGGFIKKNQPQLAVVGDNRSEGEIVAPESKIADAVAAGVAKALSMIGQTGNNNEQEQPIEITVQIGSETLINKVIDGINRENRRAGKVLIRA